MFVTGAAPNVLGLEFVARSPASRLAGCSGSRLSAGRDYFTDRCAVKPLYVLYKPEVTHSAEVAARAGGELSMGRLSRKEWTLIGWCCLA